MNKVELVDSISAKLQAGVSKKDIGDVVDAAFASITEAVKGGDRVGILGFGSFSLSERKARTGRNPKTGEAIKIAAKKTPKFTAGKPFKDAVN